ncbi:MAG: C25 family cysteine peptidase [Candidatus Zixiibacteriota bacterium]
MKLKRYLNILILLAIPIAIFAKIDINYLRNGAEIVYEPEELQIDTVEYDGKAYADIFADKVKVYPYENDGQPAIYSRFIKLGIPHDSNFDYEIIDIDYQTIDGIDIAPIVPLVNTEYESKATDLGPIYDMDQFIPDSWTILDDFSNIRGLRIAKLAIPLFRYNPANSQAEILKKIRIRIAYERDLSTNNKGHIDRHFDKIIKHSIINYEESKQYIENRNFSEKNIEDEVFNDNLDWWRIRFKSTGLYRVGFDQLVDNGIIDTETPENHIHFFSALPEMLPSDPDIPLPDMINIGAYLEDNGDGVFGSGDFFVLPAFGARGTILDSNHDFTGYYNLYDTLNTIWIGIGNDETIHKRADIIDIEAIEYLEHNYGWVYSFRKENNKVIYTNAGYEIWYWDDYDRFSVYITDPSRISDEKLPNLYMRFDPSPPSFTLDDEVLTIDTDNYLSNPNRSVFSGNLSGISNTIEGSYPAEEEFKAYEYAYCIKLMPKNDALRFAAFSDSLSETYGAYKYRLQGFDGKPYVFDITDFRSNRMMFVSEDADGYYFTDSLENREYLVYMPEALLEFGDDFHHETEFALRDNSRGANLIIITPDHFDLSEFASHRADYNDIEIETVHLDDIFREFGYGNPDPTAIREFLRYAFYNWAIAPSYAITIGDGHFDVFHKLTSKEIQFPVPLSAQYKTDDYFGTFADRESQIMVARWPVNSQREIDIITDKIIEYESGEHFGFWQRKIVTTSDDEYGYNNGQLTYERFRHIGNQSNLWEEHIPKSYDPNPIFSMEYPMDVYKNRPGAARELVDKFNEGALVLNYSGHGSAIRWAHETVFKLERDIPRLANGNKLPFVSSFSCFVSKYYLDWTECIGEELLRKKDAGSIATLASTSGSLGGNNRIFNKALFENLLKIGDMTFGQASYISKAGQYPHHDSQYMLFGDPSMKLIYPKFQIAMNLPDTFKSGQLFQIDGRIVDDGLNTVSGFNGKVRIKARDSDFMKNYVTDHPLGDLQSVDYWQPGKKIFDGEATVVNGIFEIDFIIPNSITDSTFSGNILAFGYSQSDIAAGFADSIAVFRGNEDTTDQKGPDIQVYFNSLDSDFDRICKNTNIFIEISDSNGIDITGTAGRKIVLIMDHDNLTQVDITSQFVYDEGSYSSGSIEYVLDDLDFGEHTLTVIASDNLGNSSSHETNFEVSDCEDGLYEIIPYPSPFEDDCHLTFELSTEADIALTIYTQSGRKLRTINTFIEGPFDRIYWNGCDNNGNKVGNGVYIYHIEAQFENTTETYTGKIAKLK